MKFIIVGLGNFGSTLATKLTEEGNEVIGIDNKMEKVNAIKDQISSAICMDATEKETVAGLPLENTDIVLVCIGANRGTNVLVTALFKNLGVKRLISRAADALHRDILSAIGVDEIVNPERETATKWSKKLCFHGILDSFELSDEQRIIKMNIPKQFVGMTVSQMKLQEDFGISMVTVLKPEQKRSLLGIKEILVNTNVPLAQTVLGSDDVAVIFGSHRNLDEFVKKFSV